MNEIPVAVPSADPDVIVIPWQIAPGGSHVARMKFTSYAFSESGLPSELWVTFKAQQTKKGLRPETTYVYKSTEHGMLRAVFERMTIAEHPGELIWSELIRPGVPVQGPL